MSVTNGQSKTRLVWRLLSFVIAAIALFGCCRLIVDAARAGVSRMFATVAIVQAGASSADRAVRLAPADPEAHYTRGLSLVNFNRLDEAVAEFRQAVSLRPHHYYQWLDLGVTLDRLGDEKGAEAGLRESIRLAPTFAQPRWQLGNLLFRQGKYEEGFVELRLGTRSNPTLFQPMMGLAWAAAGEDVGVFENFVKPVSPRHQLEVARFLAARGKWIEAAPHATAAGKITDEGERGILNEIVSILLKAQRYSEAYAVWATGNGRESSSGKHVDQLLNGKFVEPITQNETGFGWQVEPVPNVSVSMDTIGPSPESRSISLQFSGDNGTASQPIRQLIIVEPKTRYYLEFFAKTDSLVTGGPPVIVVSDLSSEERKILSQSTAIGPGIKDWTPYRVEFSTNAETAAISVALQRLACTQSLCPIFGRLWLSGFNLKRA